MRLPRIVSVVNKARIGDRAEQPRNDRRRWNALERRDNRDGMKTITILPLKRTVTP